MPGEAHWYEALAAEWSVTRFDTRGSGCQTVTRACSPSTRCRGPGHRRGSRRSETLPTSSRSWTDPRRPLPTRIRHPERVRHLILHSGYVRGMLRRGSAPKRLRDARFSFDQVAQGWDADHVLAREIFVSRNVPRPQRTIVTAYLEIVRQSAIGKDAVRRLRALVDIEVSDIARRVACPTLVTHAQGDRGPRFPRAGCMASLIPDARFVPLEGRSNLIQLHEPAWTQWLAEVRRFLRRNNRLAAAALQLEPPGAGAGAAGCPGLRQRTDRRAAFHQRQDGA